MTHPGDGLVDRIYEAGIVPELWPAVLASLAARFDGVGAVLIAGGRGDTRIVSSTGFEGVVAGFVEEGWAARNQRLERAMARRHPGFLTERDLFTEAELLADPALDGFFLKRGIGGELGTVIAVPTGDDLLVTVQRRFDLGPASAAAVAEADALRPHLARAAMVSARIGLERARSSAEALQAVGLPAAVLASDGRMLAVNALFAGAMPAVARDRGGRVGLADPRADALLADALGGPRDDAVTRSIPLRSSRDGEPPAVAHLIPVRRSAHDVFLGAAALLVLTPASRRHGADADLLRGLFDLTPAEARVAHLLCDGGRSVPAVAAALGISYETARKHLRSVFDKTGTGRQSELVALLGRIGA